MPRRPLLSNYGEEERVFMPNKRRHERVSNGSFSKIIKSGDFLIAEDWMFCREDFQNVSQGIRKLLFSHPKYRGYNVAAFIDRIEKKLKVKPRSLFGPTQRITITWAKISPWWTTTSMRRSLFTALLRAGTNYSPNKNNFKEALVSTKYTRQTALAIRHFMVGNTKYTGKVRGWHTQFYDKLVGYSDDGVKELLGKLLVKGLE